MAELRTQDTVKRYVVDFGDYIGDVFALNEQDAESAIALSFPKTDYYGVREDTAPVHLSPGVLKLIGIAPKHDPL